MISGSPPAVRGRYFVRASKFLPADVRGDYPSFRAAAAVKARDSRRKVRDWPRSPFLTGWPHSETPVR